MPSSDVGDSSLFPEDFDEEFVKLTGAVITKDCPHTITDTGQVSIGTYSGFAVHA